MATSTGDFDRGNFAGRYDPAMIANSPVKSGSNRRIKLTTTHTNTMRHRIYQRIKGRAAIG